MRKNRSNMFFFYDFFIEFEANKWVGLHRFVLRVSALSYIHFIIMLVVFSKLRKINTIVTI